MKMVIHYFHVFLTFVCQLNCENNSHGSLTHQLSKVCCSFTGTFVIRPDSGPEHRDRCHESEGAWTLVFLRVCEHGCLNDRMTVISHQAIFTIQTAGRRTILTTPPKTFSAVNIMW